VFQLGGEGKGNWFKGEGGWGGQGLRKEEVLFLNMKKKK